MSADPSIELLDAVWTDVADLCADLSDEQWARPTECPGWSVQDHVAHMIGTERMLAGEQPEAAAPSDAPHIRNDIGRVNEQWIASYREMTGAEVIAEFRKVTAGRLAALRALTPEEWDKEGFTPEGPGPYRQFMAIRVFDCWYHDQDIREALALPGLLDGAVADFSLARIPPRGLPYVVGKKAGVPASSTIVFEVTGAQPMIAVVAVPPEGRAILLDAVPVAPTARVVTDRRTFARLAGGRWTGDDARARGVLRVEGDEALANRVVDNMAFTI